MSSTDLQSRVAPSAEPVREPSPLVAPTLLRRLDTPLTLPTLSLLIALGASPVLWAVNAPLMLWNACPIVLRAWRVWRRDGRLNVDFLDTLAVALSLAQGDLLAGALVIWLIRLGDWIRDLTAARSRRAIRELATLEAERAWVMRDGAVVAASASDLAIGDEVVVYAGEIIPVDGDIVDGKAMVDQKTVTGESAAALRTKGETAFAATIVREGRLVVRATRVGADTKAAQIASLIESAPIGDTRAQNHAEKFADRLVLPTLALAIGAALCGKDFSFVLSLLIVDFGTGVRVAAPTAILASMIQAARSGIVFKSGAHMERLADVDTVFFDKTGTLTRGAPEIVSVVNYVRRIPDHRLIALASALETGLHHPVAAALRAKAKELSADILPCEDRKYDIGLGVEGRVSGRHVLVGNERLMRLHNIDIGKAAVDRSTFECEGCSCLYIAIDHELAGLAAHADEIRDESEALIEQLRAAGVAQTVLLTGDNGVVARAVGARLGLSRVFSDLSPADKVDVIQSFQRNGHVVAMVGDGVNDSPALSYADVGIAVTQSAEIARESANVILMEDTLSKLIGAIEMSRRSAKLIKDNCAIVAAMNAQALTLVLMGVMVNPGITALISNGSAIVASLNAVSPLLPHIAWRRSKRAKRF